MTAHDERLDAKLRALGEIPVPPPSPALLGMVHGDAGRAAQTRVPARTFALVVAAALVAVAAMVALTGVRTDLHDLSLVWFLGTACAWLAAFLVPLGIAILPRRGSVLADSGRAAIAAFAIPIAVTAMSFALRVDAPSTFIPAPDRQLHYIFNCLRAGIGGVAIPFAIAVFTLRRAAAPVRTVWIGAAAGAANGALAGLLLHAHCPIGGALHVVLGHAGASIVGAIVGAIVVPLIVGRRAT